MKRLMIRFIARVGSQEASDKGAVAAEYGVLLAGVVAVVTIAAAALGGRIGHLFDSIIP